MPSLLDLLASHSERDPDRLALLTEQDGVRTYAEFVERATAVARFLVDQNLAAGERVCVWGDNRPAWLETFVGATAAGCTPVPLDPTWTDVEMAQVLQQSGCRVLAAQPELAGRAADLVQRVSSLRVAFTLGAGATGLVGSDDLPSATMADLPDPAPVGAVLYTSGTTTGRPKGVTISAANLSGSGGFSYQEMFGLSASDRAIVVTPFFHGNGIGGSLPVLAAGGSVVFPRRFSASRFWELVDRHRPTFLFTLVPIVNILLGLRPRPLEREHGMRLIVALGSGPIAQELEDRFGVPSLDWYGMTESGQGTYTRLDEERRPGSAGRPFSTTSMRILRDDGTEAPTGEIGEVAFLRSDVGFDGYLDDDEATAAVVDGEWFRTGDLGRFDADGYFYFVDRKKDLVRRGGENISSIEVESAIREHEAIADVAVLGTPDPVLGERVAAFVVALDGHSAPDAAALSEFLTERLAAHKHPESVTYVEDLPRTTSGKIEKFRLRTLLKDGA